MSENLDLSGVVEAVKSASDKELAVLNDISRKLDGNVRGSNSKTKREAKTPKPKPVVEKVVEKTTETNRAGEIELSFAIDEPVTTQEEQAEEIKVDNSVASVADELSALESESEPTKKEKPQPIDVHLDVPESLVSELSKETTNNVSLDVEKAVSEAVKSFEGYWHDAAGKLRRADGKYASKAETTEYNNAKDVAKEREAEKQSSKVVGVFGAIKDFAVDRATSVLDKSESKDATDAAGAAAGGSYFYAAKELYGLGQDVKEMAQNTADKFETSGIKEKATSVKDKVTGWFGKGESESVASTVDSTEQSDQVSAELVSESSDISHAKTGGTDTSEKVHERDNTTTNASESKAQSVSSSEKTSAISSESKSDTSSVSSIAATKSASHQASMLEVLRESSAERESHNEAILDKLDEVIKSNNITVDTGGGITDLIGDWFGGGSDKKGKGKGKGKVGSVISSASDKVGSVASKGAGLFKGAAKMGAAGLGRAIPFLAPALAAYDAVTGFNDTEKQKEIFNLQEGEEATTGQKAATALGSVLDMGGLVSGGAGLLGDALGFLGFDGAKEALTFDSGDIAKGIYDFFAGDDESEKSETEKVTSTSSESEKATNENTSSESNATSASESNQMTDFSEQGFISEEHKQQMNSMNSEIAQSQFSVASPVDGTEQDLINAGVLEPREPFSLTDNFAGAEVVNASSAVTRNERVSDIIANSDSSSSSSSQPTTIKLDKESIDAIGKAASNNSTTDINVGAGVKPQVGGRSSAPSSPVQSTGSIPNNFSDLSLQRQAADME